MTGARGRAGRAVLGLALVACTSLGCGASAAESRVVMKPGALRRELAWALAESREWPEVVRILAEVVRADPKDAAARTLLGTAYREQGLYDAAEHEYRAAIAIAPAEPDPHDGRAIVLQHQGAVLDEVVGELRTAVRLGPRRAVFQNDLGFALFLSGRYAEAVAAFEEALRIDPSARRTHNNLGLAAGRLGDFKRAWSEFQAGGAPAVAQNNLGWVYEQEGDRESACRCYREAQALSPALDPVAANLERACRSDGAGPPGRSP